MKSRNINLAKCATILVLNVAAMMAHEMVFADDWAPFWSTTTLSVPRDGVAAASANGKILFAGGNASSGYSNVVDIYDTASATWSTTTLPHAGGDLVATSAGGKVFFTGGDNESNSYVDIYDTTNGLWSTATLTVARGYSAATSANGKAFIGGGMSVGAGTVNTVDIFDTGTGTWSPTTTLSQGRFFLSAASAGSEAFFAGGNYSTNGYLDTVDIYDAANNNAHTTTTLSQARYAAGGASADGKVFFGGGVAFGGVDNPICSDRVDIYDTANNNARTTASLSQARIPAAASVGTKVFFGGGYTGTGVSNVVDIYDTANGNSHTTAALSQARSGLAAASTANKILFGGGYTSTGTMSNVVDIYTLQQYGTIASSKAFTLVDNTTVGGLMQLSSPGSLSMGSYNLTVGSMGGNASIGLGSGTLTVGSDNTPSSTYAGAISGAGACALTKVGTGIVILTGNNSYSGTTTISNGTLQIGNGGTTASVAGNVFNNASLVVNGAGSAWNNSDSLYVGGDAGAARGAGSLTVNTGATAGVGNTLKVWNTGTVNLNGGTITAGSLVQGGTLTWGSGTLNLTNSNLILDPGGNPLGGTLTLGANKHLILAQDLTVGQSGQASMTISGGGTAANRKTIIGDNAAADGTVNVTGANSAWTNSADLYVGRAGYGRLYVLSGGAVSSNLGFVGSANAGTSNWGLVQVDGAGSHWNVGGDLQVGGAYGTSSTGGAGIVYVTGGGTISSGGNLYIARGDGSSTTTGYMTVDGVGSRLSVAGNAYVGYAGGTGWGYLYSNYGSFTDVGNTLYIPHGFVNLNGGTIRAKVVDFSSGNFYFNSGTLELNNNLTVSVKDDLWYVLGSSHTIAFDRNLTVDYTTTLLDVLTINGGVFSTGTLVNPGFLQFSSGTFNLTGSNLTVGTSGLFGATLTLPSTKSVAVTQATTIDTSGTLEMQGGVFSGGALINQGTIEGTGQINAPLTNAATGKVRAFSGEHSTFTGSSNTNQGQIQLYGGTVEFQGSLTNASAGLITGNGNLITGGLTNNGTMAFSATVNLNGRVTNAAGAKITSAGGATTFWDDVVNQGEIHTSLNSFSVFYGSVSGSGTYTGPGTVLIEGDLHLGSGGATGSLSSSTSVVVDPGATFEVNHSSNDSFTSQISGSGTLVKDGAGALILTGNSFSGNLVVNNGALTYSGASTLPVGDYRVNGGTLNLAALSQSIGSFKITGGSVTGTGTLSSNAAYDIQAGTVNAVLGGSAGLIKSGPATAVLTGANSYTGRTTVTGGVLELGTSAQNSVFNVGGADIQSGAMVFDYAAGADPAATILNLLKASRNGGRWDVGQFRDSTASATGLILGCFDDTVTHQIKVMATYPGDFNLDGVVDNQDRAIWFASAFTGTTWQQGDANYDGVVDGLDRDLIMAHIGLPSITGMPAAAGVTPVPEPSTLVLLVAALLGVGRVLSLHRRRATR